MALTLVAIAALAALVLAGGWRWGGLGRRGSLPLAAALTLGLAGYSVAGRPDLPANPTRADRTPDPFVSDRLELRDRLLGNGATSARSWLIYSDGLARAGERRSSVDVLISATRAHPGSAALQTALAFALIDYADGLVTPAADLAIGAAERLAPAAPGPEFLRGEAAARERDYGRAARTWSALLARSDPAAPWRQDVLMRLALLRRLQAAERLAPPSPAASGADQIDGVRPFPIE